MSSNMQQLFLESLASTSREFSTEGELCSLLSSLALSSTVAQLHPGCGFSTNFVDLSLCCLYFTLSAPRKAGLPHATGASAVQPGEIRASMCLHKNAVNLNKLGQHHIMAMPSQPRHRYDRAALGMCTLAACPSQTLVRKLSDKCHLIVQINSSFC